MDEEMEGMLPGPQKRMSGPWFRLMGAMAVLSVVGVMGVGMLQLGLFNKQQSIVDHVSFVHGKIGTILAVATGKKQFDTSMEVLIDSISQKENFKTGMSVKGKLKVGGDGNRPKVLVTLAAKSGKGAALKEKVSDMFEVMLTEAPHSQRDEIRNSVSFGQDGDTVTVTVTPPNNEGFNQEDEELKKALRAHKPEFNANVAVVRTFEEILAHQSANIGTQARGLEAKINGVFATGFMATMADMPGMSPSMKSTVELIRSSKLRNELFYDDDEIAKVPLPPIRALLPSLCHSCRSLSPANLNKHAQFSELLSGVTRVLLEGLPYQWELSFDMENVNPGPLLDSCAK